MAGRPAGSPNKDKPFRDALRIEAALAEAGDESPAKPGTIRWAAKQLLVRAADDTASFREAADRMDGKPAQAIVGDDDADPIKLIHEIRRSLVDPAKT